MEYFFLLFVILLGPTFSWSQNAILIFNEDFESGIVKTIKWYLEKKYEK